MTGYSLAFPKNSKYKDMFDKQLMEMRENGAINWTQSKQLNYASEKEFHKAFFAGELERLSRFWMNGICKPNEQEKRASEPLYALLHCINHSESDHVSTTLFYPCRSISQFLSAFLLLGIGTAAALLLLCVEHVYIHYIQKHVDKSERTACLSLISTV